MSAYTTGVELMKACRDKPATIAELIEFMDMDQVSLRKWVREYVEQGVLVGVPRMVGTQAVPAYQLSKHWGGAA